MKRLTRYRSTIHIAVAVPIIVLLVVVYLFLATGPSAPGRGITSVGGLIFTTAFGTIIGFLSRLALARIDVFDQGIKVVSIFTTRFVGWDEISEFAYGSQKWWTLMPNCVTVRLLDGRELQATGVQGGKPEVRLAEPTYETKTVAELNEMLELRRVEKPPVD